MLIAMIVEKNLLGEGEGTPTEAAVISRGQAIHHESENRARRLAMRMRSVSLDIAISQLGKMRFAALLRLTRIITAEMTTVAVVAEGPGDVARRYA
jgi:hypothetical protein